MNREENLKKINAELEQLSDEELDAVAGGTLNELRDLQKLFYHYTDVQRKKTVTVYKSADWIKKWLKSSLNIDAEINHKGGWFTSPGANSYSRNGESLTHEQVVAEIKAKRDM